MTYRPLLPLFIVLAALTVSACSDDSDTPPPNVDIANDGDNNGGDMPVIDDEPNPQPDPQPDPPVIDPDMGDGEPVVIGAPDVCTSDGINHWVEAQMRDYYIYYDQVPPVRATDFDNPSDLVKALRVDPDVYSSIGPARERQSLFEEGETFGFGFNWRRTPQNELRFFSIASGSPMYDAGIRRGDRILIFGDFDQPRAVTFTIATGDEEPRDVTVTSAVYSINTVAAYATYTNDTHKVGYLESSRFIRPSEAELDRAVAALIDEDLTDMILDFRYNGGGFVYIARKLASQLAGPNFVGRTFQNTTFNDKYSSFNSADQLEPQALNLSVPRLFVLTTDRTGSASEAVANNLRPYIEVILIGTRTNGKQFASVGNENCEQVLSAMDRIASNDAGQTVLGGMEPTCEVVDTFLYQQTDTRDALVNGALTYILTGACPTNVAADSAANRGAVNALPIDDMGEPELPTGMYGETFGQPNSSD